MRKQSYMSTTTKIENFDLIIETSDKVANHETQRSRSEAHKRFESSSSSEPVFVQSDLCPSLDFEY